MDRSGVLLSGAQDALGLWREGKAAPAESDGILTAGEAAELRLRGTQLVFLSAWDTGAGAGTPASGAAALRSAFLHAGARHVITTRWPIPDEETAGIVGDFYEAYFASGDVGAAFHQTQRDWLVRVRESKGLWEAVRQAGTFMLASSGAQE
jgi:CHAT domain-containing protein